MKKFSFLDALQKEKPIVKEKKEDDDNHEDNLKNTNKTKKTTNTTNKTTNNNINNINNNQNLEILQGYILKNPDTEFDDIYGNNLIDIKFDFTEYLKYEFLKDTFFNNNNNLSKYNFNDFIKLTSNEYINVINDVDRYNNECIEEDNALNSMLDEGLDDVMIEFNTGIFD